MVSQYTSYQSQAILFYWALGAPPNFTSLPLEGAWKASSGNIWEHSNITPVENLIPLSKQTIPIDTFIPIPTPVCRTRSSAVGCTKMPPM